ncbi:hypothetical protein RclHR1_03950011 [Rhizophagus clarus]|uniref:F-box domain-containing protein n=1 Tax=Rhizophagus clarus TaxID=94130 RepID=A0A2Z6RR63_9GLOM|nr:hypothetical protein RclHR1_03950011 [Rhizophagus clarus]GES92866.1 hypothetical protein GLOIN_2v1867142 [Rhizophagus clarus]
MYKLNRDVLYSIFIELRNDKNALHSCLLVNKTWCEIVISILWRNPWKYLNYRKRKILLDVIISHLPDESRNKLEDQQTSLSLYKKPFFNYIDFCKHLNLNAIKELIMDSGMWVVYDEIIHLFMNENTSFTHLHIPKNFDYQIQLIPGIERCISKIEFVSCYTNIGENILCGLIEMCKSIREIEIVINVKNNDRVAKLIRSSENLINVHFLTNYAGKIRDESFWEILEDSLIKHANSIQHLKINKQLTTQILSYLVNLKSLELKGNHCDETWNCLNNLSLPHLEILRVNNYIPVMSLGDLIENTGESLTEISIENMCYTDYDNKRLIQAIYTKCLVLKYLKIEIKNDDIIELGKLLKNCQCLEGLIIIGNSDFNWNRCFETLAKSSPPNLFMFKFKNLSNLNKHMSLKLFFECWKGRSPLNPMILQFMTVQPVSLRNKNLIEIYKAEGVIKKFANHIYNKDFEWD